MSSSTDVDENSEDFLAAASHPSFRKYPPCDEDDDFPQTDLSSSSSCSSRPVYSKSSIQSTRPSNSELGSFVEPSGCHSFEKSPQKILTSPEKGKLEEHSEDENLAVDCDAKSLIQKFFKEKCTQSNFDQVSQFLINGVLNSFFEWISLDNKDCEEKGLRKYQEEFQTRLIFQNALYRKTLQDARESKDELKKALENIDHFKECLRRVQEERHRLTISVVDLEHAKKALERELDIDKSTSEGLRLDLDDSQGRLDKLVADKEELERHLAAERQRVSDRDAELTRVRKENEIALEAAKAELKQACMKTERIREKLRKKTAECDAFLSSVEAAKEDLRRVQEERHRLTISLGDLEHAKKALERELDIEKSTSEGLRLDLDDSQGRLEKIVADKGELERHLAAERQRVSDGEAELARVRKVNEVALDAARADLEESCKQIERIREKLRKKTSECDAFLSSVEAAKEDLRRVQEERDRLTISLVDLEHAKKALERELVVEKSTSEGLRSDLDESQESLVKIIATKKELELQVAAERQRVSDRETELARVRKENEVAMYVAKADLNEARKQIERIREKLREKTAVCDALSRSLDAAKEDLRRVQEERNRLSNSVIGLEHAWKALESDLNFELFAERLASLDFQVDLGKVREELDAMKNDLRESREQCRRFERDLTGERSTSARLRADLGRKKNGCQDSLNRIVKFANLNRAQFELTISLLKKELQKLQSVNDSLSDELSKVKQEFSHLKDEKEVTCGRLSMVVEERDEFRRQYIIESWTLRDILLESVFRRETIGEKFNRYCDFLRNVWPQ